MERSTILELNPERWNSPIQSEDDTQVAELKRRITDLEDRVFRLVGGAKPTTGGGGTVTTIINNVSTVELSRVILFQGTSYFTYMPVESELIAALASALYGDSIFLPSIKIELVQGITVPQGVHVFGIDKAAILSFAGFSGTAIVLAEDVELKDLTIQLGDNIDGVDARFSGTNVEDVEIYSVWPSVTRLWTGV